MALSTKKEIFVFQNTLLIGIERWHKFSQEDPQESKKGNGSKNNFFARNKLIRSKIQGEDDPWKLLHIRIPIAKDNKYIELNSGGIMQIYPWSTSQ
jgi:hypothetical protein